MSRLLIMWARPAHLSAGEAETWAREELARVLADPAIEGGRLVRLRSASERHPRPWDWMLELRLRRGEDTAAWTGRGACAEWLADLRLLGMPPAVVVVEDEPTGEERG